MTLSGHTDVVVKCFFDENSLDVLTISRNGQAFFWECNLEFSDLILEEAQSKNDNTITKRQVNHLVQSRTSISSAVCL